MLIIHDYIHITAMDRLTSFERFLLETERLFVTPDCMTNSPNSLIRSQEEVFKSFFNRFTQMKHLNLKSVIVMNRLKSD
jgi:hypothetical protein